MSLVSLTKFISSEVCKALITSGLVMTSLPIVGATNATPIVITTARPHLIYTGAVVQVRLVGGNTAANDFWNVTVLSTTTFALDGSVGSASYTSGGFADVAILGGKILLGRQWVRQTQASPRIVFIPMSGEFPARDQYAMANPPNLSEPQRQALLAPSVLTHRNLIEVQCWGRAPTPDPDNDFTYTELLRDQVIRTCDALLRGNFTCKAGQWEDQNPQSTQDMKLGHVYKFQLMIDAPVTVVPQEFAPAGVGSTSDVYFQSGNLPPPPELAETIET